MYFNVHAIVLSSRKSGESERRLFLYTRELGRLPALLAGAGKPSSRMAPAAEPAVESRFRLWMRPGAASARVTGGSVSSGFPALRASWTRMSAALFLCEWTEKLTAAQQPHPEKYDLLRSALAALETGDEALVRSAFLLQFLERAGYACGADVLGPAEERWRPLVDALRAYDFSPAPAPAGLRETAPALEAQILRFVSPLLHGPLKSVAHRRALEDYLKGAEPRTRKDAAKLPAPDFGLSPRRAAPAFLRPSAA
ncbi:MAG: DNA repair protein RecO [Elusimicrobiota bacterium]